MAQLHDIVYHNAKLKSSNFLISLYNIYIANIYMWQCPSCSKTAGSVCEGRNRGDFRKNRIQKEVIHGHKTKKRGPGGIKTGGGTIP